MMVMRIRTETLIKAASTPTVTISTNEIHQDKNVLQWRGEVMPLGRSEAYGMKLKESLRNCGGSDE